MTKEEEKTDWNFSCWWNNCFYNAQQQKKRFVAILFFYMCVCVCVCVFVYIKIDNSLNYSSNQRQ